MLARDIEPRQRDTAIMLEHAVKVDRALLPLAKQDNPSATWKDLDLVQVNIEIHFSRGDLGVRCKLDQQCRQADSTDS